MPAVNFLGASYSFGFEGLSPDMTPLLCALLLRVAALVDKLLVMGWI